MNILEITFKASRAITWEQTTLKGETPLLVAVRNCFAENVHFLLFNGCNPNVKNEEGDSPLVVALQYALKDEVMLRMLMNYGYEVHLCFDCPRGNASHSQYVTDGWTSTAIKDTTVLLAGLQ
ncbi:dynein axonemal heavy chain 12-like isoform X2 [Anser cygnoides]|uniref:dynein axonemal heavy chain 12-like isoform X2 n=1 Tax=Anser cygnoides TaxID=8845 RepID=UPI0034D1CD2F